MKIPATRWYEVIEKRRSRRKFQKKQLEKKLLIQLAEVCEKFRPFSNARSELIVESPDSIFKGIIGSYGKITNAPAAVAFIGNMDNKNVIEQVGYTGEGIILEAEALNLETCWVAGFINRKVATSLLNIGKNELILAVTPIGYATSPPSFGEKLMTGFGLTHKRKPLSNLVTGLKESEWPRWIKIALEAARIAPSAINRQPWRFKVSKNSITVSVNYSKREYGLPKRLCCGIAMLHIETAAIHCGILGKWDLLNPPLVARYKVS